jgi:hypothetical protein
MEGAMPEVLVRAHGGLGGGQASAGYKPVSLPDGATLLDLQDRLGIPRGEVGLFVVNGELRDESHTPAPAAQVDLYPMFGGG